MVASVAESWTSIPACDIHVSGPDSILLLGAKVGEGGITVGAVELGCGALGAAPRTEPPLTASSLALEPMEREDCSRSTRGCRPSGRFHLPVPSKAYARASAIRAKSAEEREFVRGMPSAFPSATLRPASPLSSD